MCLLAYVCTKQMHTYSQEKKKTHTNVHLYMNIWTYTVSQSISVIYPVQAQGTGPARNGVSHGLEPRWDDHGTHIANSDGMYKMY